MAKLVIEILKSVNGVAFGATEESIHKHLGNDFTTEKKMENSQDNDDFLLEVAMQFSEMTGKPVETYTKYLDDEQYDFENSGSSDSYSFARIDYDENKKFEAIEIYSDQQTELIIDGNDYSDFNLTQLLTLADDFVSEENNTAWTSYSKQIGIWCPDGDSRVECILFGCPGYYDCLEKE